MRPVIDAHGPHWGAKGARDLFAHFAALAGPTGLMSEEYGVSTRRALGNHPQAYTHAGLIECAVALAALDA
ncbi:MAG: hypothetical protein KDA21_06100 [Phycisphaerales bacterium]|nr:hypothetical protein [Phycisphaerales bacterium]